MSTLTRRRALAGAAVGLAAPAVARAVAAADAAQAAALPASVPRASRTVVRRGRAIAVTRRGDRLVVAHDQRHTIAVSGHGRTVVLDVGGQPLDLALSPDGRLAAVVTASWAAPGLALVDVRAGTLLGRVGVGPAPAACAFTPDGRRVLVAGGDQQGTVHVVDVASRKVLAQQPVGLNPSGIAAARRGGLAWVALNGDARVLAVDTRTARVRKTRHTLPYPDRLALSPDGRRMLLMHGGRDVEHVGELVLATGETTRHRAGRLPSAVAYTRSGRRLVALGGEAAIVVLGRRGGRRLPVGGAPRGLAVAGTRAWTVDALTGQIRKVRV